jgi:uncharacterized protein (DUF433 family)
MASYGTPVSIAAKLPIAVTRMELNACGLTPVGRPQYNVVMKPTNHIEITPGTCSGHPRVAGTRIRVHNIVLWTEQGETPDEIAAAYPPLTLSDVYTALAFYHDNREEMDRVIQQDKGFLAAASAKHAHAASRPTIDMDADAGSIPS